jgi:malonate-semialdehyde dehydrogenase (acetylating)/methylmalonate-semialdehyde dehydrogenase
MELYRLVRHSVLRRAWALRTPSCNSFSTSAFLDGGGKFKYFSDNSFVASSSTTQSSLQVINPATQEVIGTVPENTDHEFNTVIAKSTAAFKEWSTVPVQQRQRVMLEYQRLIRLNTDDLAKLITMENGKTIADAKGDVFRGLEVVETACQVAPHMLGDSMSGISASMDTVSFRKPLGVCAGICPFNFPGKYFMASTFVGI